MKKLGLVTMVLLILAGCAYSDGKGPTYQGAYIQNLPDGRSVICVYAGSGSGGPALSCDWETATLTTGTAP